MSEGEKRRAGPILVGRGILGEVAHDERTDDFSPEWCQALLRDPSYERLALLTRKLGARAESSYNSFVGKTLFTDDTVRAVVLLRKRDHTNYQANHTQQCKGVDHSSTGGELLALVSLGGEMCSHADTLHGGANVALIDEIGGALGIQVCATPLITVNFNVNLRRAVHTPGIVLGRAWVERPRQGRKVWIRVRLEQDGQTCSDSEILYLQTQPQGRL